VLGNFGETCFGGPQEKALGGGGITNDTFEAFFRKGLKKKRPSRVFRQRHTQVRTLAVEKPTFLKSRVDESAVKLQAYANVSRRIAERGIF